MGQASRNSLRAPESWGTRPWSGEAHEVRRFDVVQLENTGKGFENLHGGVAVTTSFQPQVVVGADPGEERDFLPPQTRHTPVRTGRKAELLRRDQPSSGAEVVTERMGPIVVFHVLDTIDPVTTERGSCHSPDQQGTTWRAHAQRALQGTRKSIGK